MLDVLLQDRSNEIYILNSLVQIVRDLYSQPFVYNNLVSIMSSEPGPYYLTENLFGLRTNLTIELPFSTGGVHCI
jgi:hypothetical protein